MSFSFTTFHSQADKALTHLQKDLSTLRTGRASVQMLDGVRVEAYGSMMQIHEVANVSAPDPTLLVVKPWDPSVLEAIEKAIAKAELNLNPVVDGDIIRIAVPPLTTERRQEMVKSLHQKVESGKVMLRSIRTEIKKEIEASEGEDNVSEDDIHADLKKLDELVEAKIKEIDRLAENKEAELMKI